jgi:hypothetical protein
MLLLCIIFLLHNAAVNVNLEMNFVRAVVQQHDS